MNVVDLKLLDNKEKNQKRKQDHRATKLALSCPM